MCLLGFQPWQDSCFHTHRNHGAEGFVMCRSSPGVAPSSNNLLSLSGPRQLRRPLALGGPVASGGEAASSRIGLPAGLAATSCVHCAGRL